MLEQRMLLSADGLAPAAPLPNSVSHAPVEIVVVDQQADTDSVTPVLPADDSLVDTTAPAATTVQAENETEQAAPTTTAANETPAPVNETAPVNPEVQTTTDLLVTTLNAGNGPPASGTNYAVGGAEDFSAWDPPLGGFNYTATDPDTVQRDADYQALTDLFDGTSDDSITMLGRIETREDGGVLGAGYTYGLLVLQGEMTFALHSDVGGNRVMEVTFDGLTTANFTAGNVTLKLVVGKGGFLISGDLANPDTTGGLAGTMEVNNISELFGTDETIALISMTGGRFSINTTGAAVSATNLGGETENTFDFTTATKFARLSGNLSLSLGGTVGVSFAGNVTFAVSSQVLTFTLAAGTVTMNAGTLAMTATVSAAFQIKAAGVIGTVAISGLSVNAGGVTFAPGASGSITIDTTGSSVQATVSATVDMSITTTGVGVTLAGTFTFDRSLVDGVQVIRINVTGASTSLTAGSASLSITGITGAFIITNDGVAGKASVAGVTLTPTIAGFTFSPSSLEFEINTTGLEFDNILIPGPLPQTLNFVGLDRKKFFRIQGNVALGLDLGGIAVSLNGTFYFEKFNTDLDGAGSGAAVDVVKFAALDATASFTAGPMVVEATDVTGGFVITDKGVAGSVRAVGLSITGVPGLTAFNASAITFDINTTNEKVDTSVDLIGAAPVTLNFTQDSQKKFVSVGASFAAADGSDFTLDLGAAVFKTSGSFVFYAGTVDVEDPLTHAVTPTEVVKFGLNDVNASLTVAGITAAITHVKGFVVLVGDKSAGRIQFEQMTISGINDFTFAADDFAFEFNTTGGEISEQLVVGTETIELEFTDADHETDFFRGSGTMTIAFDNGSINMSIEGTFAFEQYTDANVGTVVKFAFQDVNFTVGVGSVSLNILEADGFFIFGKNTAGVASYAGRLHITNASLTGVNGLTLNVDNFNFAINTYGEDISTTIEGPDSAVTTDDFTLDLDGVPGGTYLSLAGTARLEVSLSGGAFTTTIAGTFFFEQTAGKMKVGVRNAQFIVEAGSIKLKISEVNGLFVLYPDDPVDVDTDGTIAMQLEVGTVELDGITGLDFGVENFFLRYNNAGENISEDFDFGDDGDPLTEDNPTLSFDDDILTLGGTVHLTMTFGSAFSTTINGSFFVEQTATKLLIGVSDANFSLAAGTGGVALKVERVNGKFALYDGGTMAMQLSVGKVSVEGITGLEFEVEDFFLQYNTAGDIDPESYTYKVDDDNDPATPAVSVTETMDFDANIIQLGGTVHLKMAFGSSFSTTINGSFFFEQTAARVLIGIKDASFNLEAGGVAFEITEVNGKFALYSAGTMAMQLSVGKVALTGITGLTFRVTDFFLKYNNAGDIDPESYTFMSDDDNDAATPKVSVTETMDFDANIIQLGGTVELGMAFGTSFSTTIKGTFFFEQTAAKVLIGIKDASFNLEAGGVAFEITEVNGKFALYSAGTMAMQLSVGKVELSGITGLEFKVTNFFLKYNNAGDIDPESYTFMSDDDNDPLTPAVSVTETMDFDANIIQLGGTVRLKMAFGSSFSTTIAGTFFFEQTAAKVLIGIKDASFNLEAGGVAFEITEVNGKFALYSGGTMAMQLSVGKVELSGINGLTFRVTNFFLKYNNAGDIDPESYTFMSDDDNDPLTPAVSVTETMDFDANIIQLGGTVELGMAFGSSFSTTIKGTFFFEQTAAKVLIGIKDASFNLEVGGVALEISEVNGKFALYDGGTMAMQLSVGKVELSGINGLTFKVTNFFLKYNNAGDIDPESYTFMSDDDNDAATPAVSVTETMDFDTNIIQLGGTVELTLAFGSSFATTIKGTFFFEQTAARVLIAIKDASFSLMAGGVELSITEVNGKFALYGGGTMAMQLSVGKVALNGINGLTFKVTDFFLKYNNAGDIDPESYTFMSDDDNDPLTPAVSVTETMDFDEDIIQLGGTVELGLTVGSFSATINGTFFFEQTAAKIKIGMLDAGMSLTVGMIGFAITNVDGAIVLYPDTAADADSDGTIALQLSIGSVSLTGVPAGFTLEVTNFFLNYNNTGDEVHEEFEFGDGTIVNVDFDADILEFGGSIEIHFGSYLEITADNVVVNTGATGTQRLFQVEHLGGVLSIPALGGPISVDVSYLSITAQGKIANYVDALGDEYEFKVEVSFGPTDARPDAATFKWPAWLPIKLQYLSLTWDDIGNNPSDFILSISATVEIVVPGIQFHGMVEELEIDIGKLVDGDFPIIGFKTASVSISGQFGGLNITGGVVLGTIPIDEDGHVITDGSEPDQTIFYFGLYGEVEIVGIGGAGVRVGIAEFNGKIVPLEAFISVQAPVIIEPISGLTIGGFFGGIQFASDLVDEDYGDIDNLKAVTTNSITNPTLAQWNQRLKDATLAIFVDEDGSVAGDPDVWGKPMVITAMVTLYSSYISRTALEGNVLVQFDTQGRVLIVGELLFGGGNLKLDAKLYMDLTDTVGGAELAFYASYAPVGVTPKPFEVWGTLVIEILHANGDRLTAAPNTPAVNYDDPLNPPATPALAGQAAVLRISLEGGVQFVAGGAMIVRAEGFLDITVDFSDPGGQQVTSLVFAARVGIVAPTPNPLGPDFGKLTGSIVIFSGTGGFDMYGAVKVEFEPDTLKQYGLDIHAEAFLQINTTSSAQTVRLQYLEGTPEDVEIRKESFSLYIKGDVKLGAPNSEPEDAFITMNGYVTIEIDSNGLTLSFGVVLYLAPGGTQMLKLNATGLMRINQYGIAARLDMQLVGSGPGGTGEGNMPSGSGLAFEADFTLILNTMERVVTYTKPDFVLTGAPGEVTTITIAQAAPMIGGDLSVAADNDSDPTNVIPGEMYFLISVDGTLTAFDTLVLDGKFFLLITEDMVQLQVDASLEFGDVGTLDVSGFLEITADGAAGLLSISTTLSLPGIVIDDARFLLAFNTYDYEYELPEAVAEQFEIPYDATAPPTLEAELIQIEIAGTVTIGGTLELEGRFFFKQSTDTTTGAVTTIIKVQATLSMPIIGVLNVKGDLVIYDAASGHAGAVGSLEINISTGNESALATLGFEIANASMRLKVNTTGTALPDPAFTDPAIKIAAHTVEIDLTADVTLIDIFTFNGHFYLRASLVNPLDLTIEFDATLSITVGTFKVTGYFDSDDTGFSGQLTLELTSSSTLASLGFNLHGEFVLGVNSKPDVYEMNGLSGDLAQFNGKELEEGELLIYVAGGITVFDTLEITGSFYLSSSPGRLEIEIHATMRLDGLGNLNVDGFAGVYANNPSTPQDEGGLLLAINVRWEFGISDLFEAEGDIRFRLNTTGIARADPFASTNPGYTAATSSHPEILAMPSTIAADSLRIRVSNLSLTFLEVLTITGSLDITYGVNGAGVAAPGLFTLRFNAGIDFFGIASIRAEGYFDSRGNYEFGVYGEVKMGIQGFFGFRAAISFNIKGDADGVISLTASLNGTAWLVGISFNLGIDVSYDGNTGRIRAHLSITIDFFFFSISFGGDFDLGYIKPTRTFQAGTAGAQGWVNGVDTGTLYVNVGARAGYRNYSAGDTQEQVFVYQTTEGIEIELFGKRKTYTGVTGVVIDTSNNTALPGDDNDYVYIDASVTVPVTIITGKGVDVVQMNGSGKANINVGDGDDVVDGGSGNDTINGGLGNDILRGHAGGDTINGGDGDDVIVGGLDGLDDFGNLKVDELNGDAGNDSFVWAMGDGDDTMNGGSGTDTLTITGTSAAETITVNPDGVNYDVVISPTLTLDATSFEGLVTDLKAGGDTVIINYLASSGLVSVSVLLGSGSDSVIIQGNDTAADIFRVSSTTDNPATNDGNPNTNSDVEPDSLIVARVATVTSTTPLLTFNIYQGNPTADTVTVNGNGGNDVIDAHNTVHARTALVLDGGAGNDTILGSAFADRIKGGTGSDTLTGGPGVDLFEDGSTAYTGAGDDFDTLVEYMDVNYTVDGVQLTANGETETLPAIFETISLTGGAAVNVFTVRNFSGVLILNGATNNDQYIISIKGTGTSNITIADNGVGANTNTLRVNGTSGVDTFLLRAGVIYAGADTEIGHLEVINYTGLASFTMYGGDGGDRFTIDETLIEGVIYGEAGADEFTVGRILADEDQAAPSGIETIDTDDRGWLSYGNRAVLELRGGDNGDLFTVNHNQAELRLFGENGDDRFFIRTYLEEGSAYSNVNGGTGSNQIQYVQNGPVKIDGGAGFDTLILEGTNADDVFIITDTDILGGGRSIEFVSIERIEVYGLGGADTFWVLGNSIPLSIDGGAGNDTIHIGGQAPDFVYDAPEVRVNPPAYTVTVPVFVTITIPAFTIPGFFAFTGIFPFFTWVPAFYFPGYSVTVFSHFTTQTIDPPETTYDPPPRTYRFANVTNLNGVTNGVEIYTSGNATAVDPDNTTVVPTRKNLGTLAAPLRVDGGTDGADDRLEVHLSGATGALTGRMFSTIETDSAGLPLDPIGQIVGLGFSSGYTSEGRTFMDGVLFKRLDNINFEFGAFNDTLTIGSNASDRVTVPAYAPGYTDAQYDNGTFDSVHVTVNGNAGNDTVNLRANTGAVTFNGGTGNDLFNLGSNASNLSNTGGNLDALAGAIIFDGGANTDSLSLDDRGDTTDNVLTLTQTTLTGMGLGAGITSYTTIESLLIGFGSGSDIANVRGTSVPTTLELNGGNDSIYVSSTADVTTATRDTTFTLGGHLDDVDGSLLIQGGDGRQRLMVSDRDTASANGTSGTPAVITDSTLTGFSTGTITYNASATGDYGNGITVWTGSGADYVSVTSIFLRNGLRNTTSLNTGAGIDTISINLPNAPNAFFAVHAGSGNDTVTATGSLGILIFGGDGADTITAGLGNHLIFGDEGTALYQDGAGTTVARYGSGGVDDFTDAVIRNLTSAEALVSVGGGADLITTSTGNDLIFGGAAGDTINAGEGDNLVVGDHATITLTGGLLTQINALATGGGNDTITTGAGRDLIIGGTGADGINAGAGANIVFGDHGDITLVADVVTYIVTIVNVDGGVDTITTLGGRDFILGGEAGDTINAGDGDNGVAGDFGRFTITSGTAFSFVSMDTTVGGNDTITTGTGADTIAGGLGADVIVAGAGRNLVTGDHMTASRDTAAADLTATSISDALLGVDSITTGADEDVIFGGASADTIDAGNGLNIVFGDVGTVTITAGLPVYAATTITNVGTGDTITTGTGVDIILGGDGADLITAGNGQNLVFGDYGIINWTGALLTSASATAAGIGGIDDITTGSDADIILGGNAGDIVHAGAGADLIIGDQGTITFTAGLATDIVNAPATGDGNDQLFGEAGNDVILGGSGADSIDAGGDHNTVVGDHATIVRAVNGGALATVTVTSGSLSAGGNDTITTGSGNDLIIAGAGADTVNAGTGTNVVLGDEGRIETSNFILSLIVSSTGAFADTITTGANTDYILGGGANDTIHAGAGTNVILGDHGSITFTAGVLVQAVSTTSGGGNDAIDAGDGYNLVIGGFGTDTIIVANGTNVVLGDQGQIDVNGPTLISANTFDAGTGARDIVTAGNGTNWIFGGDANDTLTVGNGFAAVFGDHGRIDLTGAGVLTLLSLDFTSGGADTITTGSGDDIILGGSDSDTINGGEGNNVVLGDHGQVITDTAGLDFITTLAPTQGAADVITTGAGNDIIFGGAGADEIHAGAGRNAVFGDHGNIDLVAGDIRVATSSDYAIGDNDLIETGLGDDLIVGGFGADSITAGDGANVVLGDQGTLNISGGVLIDVYTEQPAIGDTDTIVTGAGSDVILGGLAADTITAGNGNNFIVGDHAELHWVAGILARMLSIDFGDGAADEILSGSGNDVILAGPDEDTIDAGDGDNIVFGDNGEIYWTAGVIDLATTEVATDIGANDDITTGSGNDLILGGTLDDTIDAGEGDNVVFGDNGEAIFTAGIRTEFSTFSPDDAGNDIITSGTGDDVILGGAGQDEITIDGGDNIVFGDEAELSFDGAGILVEAISIELGSGGADTVTTGAGDDLVVGGTGNDTINAGDGNNIVFGDNADALYSGGLPAFLQTLNPEFSANDNITTGAGRDLILGGQGSDSIAAGDGDDVVLGDEGSITLSGGIIAEAISESFADGMADVILGQGGNDLIIGGNGSDQINGGEGNNVITGDNAVATFSGGIIAEVEILTPAIGSPDTINTGAGNDVILGGAAGDTINGGEGDNVVAGDQATITFLSGVFATLTPTTPEIGGNDSITTGAGADRIVGGTGADWINAGDGHNVVTGDHAIIIQNGGALTSVESMAFADGGVDLIFTGSGDDLVIGGTAGDTIHSGAGNDLVFGDHALVSGAIDLSLLPLAMAVHPFTFTSISTQNVGPDGRSVAGDDVVFAGAGDDIVLGQQGADILYGEDGDDDLIGGHNVTLGQDAADVIDAGAGYDVIAGDNAAILRTGTNVSPRAHVLAGDAMFDDRGRFLDLDDPQAWPTAVPERATIILDHAFGTDGSLFGNDQLVGGAGDDVIFGQLGNDQLHGDAALPVAIAGDGTIDRAAVRATADALFTTNFWAGADSDGDDYIEGNGGDDLVFGGLGQDDIVGGSSSLFGLVTYEQRPDGGDTLYGGNGTAATDETASDGSLNGRARDADVILGDNGNIFRLVGLNGVNAGAFLTFSYAPGAAGIIVRGFDLLDYTVPESPTDIGAADTIYGEAGDDTLHGQVGTDLMYGNGNDDNLYGGQGDDNIFGGAGDDSISNSDELKPPPPAEGQGGAAEGNGAQGTAAGTVILVLPGNIQATLEVDPATGEARYLIPRTVYTGFSTGGAVTINSREGISTTTSGWRIFSSSILPSQRLGSFTSDANEPVSFEALNEAAGAEGEGEEPQPSEQGEQATPPAEGEQPPAAPAEGETTEGQPAETEGEQPPAPAADTTVPPEAGDVPPPAGGDTPPPVTPTP